MIRRLFFELRYLFDNTPWDTGISPPELIDYLRTHPPGSALDLGCGTGTNAMTMGGFGWTVLGVDISSLAIFLARRKARASSAHVKFMRADVTRAGIDAQPFDLVLDIGCFHALPLEKKEAYIQKLVDLTHIGSDYLLYTWLKATAEDPDIAPTEASLHQRLTPFFELLDLTYGSDHDRTSAWVHAMRVT
jgi:SAM-dependent methyltransferase